MKKTISERGLKATQTELRSDLEMFFEAKENMWAAENLEGKFPLNMAENNLSWNLLQKKISEIMKTQSLPKWVSNYTGIVGHDSYLEAIAHFMSKHLTDASINPENLMTSAGATAVLEVASWILCDKGDVAAFPAPCYPVYTQDINNKAAVERYDLITHHDIHDIMDGPLLSIDHLEKAKKDIAAKGKNFKMLVLTTPDNPTGGIYNTALLISIAEWCIEHGVHLLVNELYGLSIIDTQHPSLSEDYKVHYPFSSFAQIMTRYKSDFLHLAYGLSKDLGISGFRVGILYSLNQKIIEAYKNMNAPHMVSNLTQWIVQEVLNDDNFMTDYIRENKRKLTDNYVQVIETLKKCKVPYAPARGSLFVWLELSHLMNANTAEAESKLWMDIYNKTGILLTPGDGFGHSKHGQFRLVYSFMEKKPLEIAMQRFKTFLETQV